jgi:hypothetical protein
VSFQTLQRNGVLYEASPNQSVVAHGTPGRPSYAKYHRGGPGSKERIARSARSPGGGFTYQPLTTNQPTTGWAVSIYPEHEVKLKASEVTRERVHAYVQDRMHVFRSDPQAHLGGWHDPDTGTVYLDISRVVGSRAEAMRLGREHRQKAVYSLDEGESHEVG